jgi:hypothetical protein
VYPGADGREDELGDGDQDAATPLVPDAEDLLAICLALAACPAMEGNKGTFYQ